MNQKPDLTFSTIEVVAEASMHLGHH